MSNKQRTHNQGFAHIILIVVAVGVVLALGVAAYFAFGRNFGSAEARLVTTTEQKAANAACKDAIKDETFCIYAASWSLDDAYTTTMTTDQGTIVSKNDGKGNSSSTITKDGAVNYGTVTIGNTYYTKNVLGEGWYKTEAAPTEPDESTSSVTEELDFEDKPAEDKTVYKNLGTEACGNLTCYKYEISNPDSPDSTTTIWFDNKDYKTRKMAFTSEGKTTEITYEYGNVTITAPSPIVEQPDYSNMSVEELQALAEKLGQ